MMNATLFVREDEALLNNSIFNGEPLYGMKSDTYMFIALRRELKNIGIELATQDIHDLNTSEIIICLDQPLFFKDYRKKENQKLYLILSEPATYYPLNWLKENHEVFDKVFTYDYDLIDNVKYFHYNFAIDFAAYPPFELPNKQDFEKRKLCCLMAAAFSAGRPTGNSQSLLYERFDIVRWFADHHPQDFYLFSRGIKEKAFTSFRGVSLLRRFLPESAILLIAKYYKNKFLKVHHGPVEHDRKIDKLKEFRFYICYENTSGVHGLISEKIFDCFAAGCIPIYLGDPRIEALIPEGCYIDRRKFRTNGELYRFIKNMGFDQYNSYMIEIEKFLKSPEINRFSVESYTRNLLGYISQDCRNPVN